MSNVREKSASYENECEFYRKELVRLKKRVNNFAAQSICAEQAISDLSSQKLFKFVHLIRRFKFQFLKGNKEDRKNFCQWLLGHFHHKISEDQSFNPIFTVSAELKRYEAPDKEVITFSEMLAAFPRNRIDIITPQYTSYVADQISCFLKDMGMECMIHSPDYEEFEEIPYIIICAQRMKKLPDCYACFQMEQTVSDKWFTDRYYKILRDSYAVLDYSKINIAFLSQFADLKDKLYYVPIGVSKQTMKNSIDESGQKYDILFYGSLDCERRKRILSELQKEFPIEIETALFGQEMLEKINQSRIVVNIHYYENSLLETTRLAEVLSLGNSLIVSEKSNDPVEDARMNDLIDFVDIDDIDALRERLRFWLTHEEDRRQKLEKNRSSVSEQLGDMKTSFSEFIKSSGLFRVLFEDLNI